MSAMPPQLTVAERLAEVIADLSEAPAVLQPVCRSLLVDVAGLCIAARHTDFMRATVQASDLTLGGFASAGATVTGVTVLPGNTTARFTLDGITTGDAIARDVNVVVSPETDPVLAVAGSFRDTGVDVGAPPGTPIGSSVAIVCA